MKFKPVLFKLVNEVYWQDNVAENNSIENLKQTVMKNYALNLLLQFIDINSIVKI